jgi:UDP-N-acetylglucosamine 2-epimerase (non-hydrolysing)
VTRPIIDLIAGARPNFMKVAPVIRALQQQDRLAARVVHTGQHYDPLLSDVFFAELQIPAPAVHLEVGSGPQGAQTARILERYEAQLLADRPAATVVFGDVNSTLACALAAVKLQVPVAHVEAGLRSFDASMPEEVNRKLTDAVADLLLVSEKSGLVNLRHEGIPEARIQLVGNVMIDTLLLRLPDARARQAWADHGLSQRGYGFVTLHRPSNVDDAATLSALLGVLEEIAAEVPLVFAVHPRTRASAARHGLASRLTGARPFFCVEPLPYLESLSLACDAAFVITDSGGLQEETSVLGVPCLTARENTERPITVELGTSRLVGHHRDRLLGAFHDLRAGRWPTAQPIPQWDGQSGPRVARALADWLRA